MSEITQIISSVGFPIAMCLLMGFYIKYTTDTHREDLKHQQENHKDTASRLATAIDNNTSVLEELSVKLNFEMKGDSDDGK